MKNKRDFCCIFNVAPHYNGPLYQMMEQHLHCDFFIGDKLELPIQLMDYNELSGFRRKLRNIFLLGHFYWQKGALSTVFKPYRHYLMTAEVYNLSTWILLLLLRFSGKKSYLWTHGWYGNEGLIKRIIKKMFFKLADGIFLYGEYAKKLMIQEGFNPEKLHVIYNSMDYDQQLSIRQQLKETEIYQSKFGNDAPVLIYVGRIQKMKKLEMLIQALKDLCDENLSCNLVIVGKMIEKSDLEELVIKLNLTKQVWFYGPCFDEKLLGELFYNARVCVTPGNIGLTAIHSMMYGTPVITHNQFSEQGPEFEAVVPGVTGDFFTENNQQALNDVVKKYITDKENRLSMRNKLYDLVDEKYNPHRQIELLKKVIYPKSEYHEN